MNRSTPGFYYQQKQYVPTTDKYVYFDNAASTRSLPCVIEAMLPAFTELYANPEATHEAGQRVRDVVENCRARIAQCLDVKSHEIYFTSGASESINAFVRGIAQSNCTTRKKIIHSAIEHKAVVATCEDLVKLGYYTQQAPVLPTGLVDLDVLAQLVDDETLLVCIILGNNELGVLQPIERIADIVHSQGALLFSDTTQIAGRLPVFPRRLGIDAMCVSGHKIHGPKGIGCLFMTEDLDCAPLITGGHQERGQRAGTPNTAGIIGLCTAIEKNMSFKGQQMQGVVRSQRDWIENEMTRRVPRVIIQARNAPRINNISNMTFFSKNGRVLDKNVMIAYLANKKIIVSGGSACNAGLDRSQVLAEVGLSDDLQNGTLRISLSSMNSWDDCIYLIESLVSMINEL